MYSMYLTQELDNETLVLRFPVLPEKIGIKGDIDNKKYNVLALGDILRPGKRGLSNYSIESYYPYDSEPSRYINIVETMIANEKPIRFIINKVKGSKIDDLNVLVLIDSFSYDEEGGEPGDIYFSYKFSEYREHEAKVNIRV